MNKTFFTSWLLLFSGLFIAGTGKGMTCGRDEVRNDAGKEETLIVTSAPLDFTRHRVTFIELGADRCIPCKAMQPIMREIAVEYQGSIQVVFYDVWKFPEFAKEYGIQMIPTQVFINSEGKEIYRHVGFFAKDDIIDMLKAKGILQLTW